MSFTSYIGWIIQEVGRLPLGLMAHVHHLGNGMAFRPAPIRRFAMTTTPSWQYPPDSECSTYKRVGHGAIKSGGAKSVGVCAMMADPFSGLRWQAQRDTAFPQGDKRSAAPHSRTRSLWSAGWKPAVPVLTAAAAAMAGVPLLRGFACDSSQRRGKSLTPRPKDPKL